MASRGDYISLREKKYTGIMRARFAKHCIVSLARYKKVFDGIHAIIHGNICSK